MKQSFINKLFYILCLFFLSSVFSQPREDFLEEIVIEDFENQTSKEYSFRIYSNSEVIPEIKKTKTLTSPNLFSNHSLFLRFPKGTTDQNIEIKFTNPRQITNYVLYFKLQIFANTQGGSISLILEDSNFEVHILPVTVLNFNGWKEIIVKLSSSIKQDIKTLHSYSSVKVLGFLYTPDTSQAKNREDLFALDDIIAITLPKFKLPANFMNLN